MVGAVETTEEFLGLDDVENILPLLLSWVDTGWVVGAYVEKHKGVVLAGLEVGNHAIKVESLGLFVEVAGLLVV